MSGTFGESHWPSSSSANQDIGFTEITTDSEARNSCRLDFDHPLPSPKHGESLNLVDQEQLTEDSKSKSDPSKRRIVCGDSSSATITRSNESLVNPMQLSSTALTSDGKAAQRFVRPNSTVQHNYSDRASIHTPIFTSESTNSSLIGTRARLGSTSQFNQKSSVRFPDKLHAVLEQTENDGLADIISWQPHGRCFVLRQPDKLAQLLERHFPTITKLTSFRRQLNLYGFRRISHGKDRNGYYHEFFLRYRPHLTGFIHRFNVKGVGVRVGSNPDEEPNFYSMPLVLPLEMDRVGMKSANKPAPSVACASSLRASAPPLTLLHIKSLCAKSAYPFDEPPPPISRSMQHSSSSPTINSSPQEVTDMRRKHWSSEDFSTLMNLSTITNFETIASPSDDLEPKPLPPWPLRLVSTEPKQYATRNVDDTGLTHDASVLLLPCELDQVHPGQNGTPMTF
jgi:hypothetical protein